MSYEEPLGCAHPHSAQLPRLLFLIRSLNRGGAERQLLELVKKLAQRGFPVTVCTFYDGGALSGEAQELPGVRLVSLGKRGRWDLPQLVWRFADVVRRVQPDIIHGYMPVANELSLLMARLFRKTCIFGLRASNVDFSRYGRVAKAAFSFGAICSRFADATIVNSEAGRAFHALNGYDSKRTFVIPNGIDTTRFCPNVLARDTFRRKWSVGATDRIVGVVARLDPMKDHLTFIAATAIVLRAHPNTTFVCVGEGPPSYQKHLANAATAMGVGILWTGGQSDTAGVYNALDILVLSSAFGEGFPNAVGEAMSTGKPCVVTDVGDAATVVGETGIVVPPNDPVSLAAGIIQLLDLPAPELHAKGAAAHARVRDLFSITTLVNSTEQILLDTAKRVRAL